MTRPDGTLPDAPLAVITDATLFNYGGNVSRYKWRLDTFSDIADKTSGIDRRILVLLPDVPAFNVLPGAVELLADFSNLHQTSILMRWEHYFGTNGDLQEHSMVLDSGHRGWPVKIEFVTSDFFAKFGEGSWYKLFSERLLLCGPGYLFKRGQTLASMLADGITIRQSSIAPAPAFNRLMLVDTTGSTPCITSHSIEPAAR